MPISGVLVAGPSRADRTSNTTARHETKKEEGSTPSRMLRSDGLPHLMKPNEAARFLRVTPSAFYQMVARGQVAGIVRRTKRRMVVVTDVLLHSLHQQVAPSTARSVR